MLVGHVLNRRAARVVVEVQALGRGPVGLDVGPLERGPQRGLLEEYVADAGLERRRVHGAHRQPGAAVDRRIVDRDVAGAAGHDAVVVRGELICGLHGDDVVVVRHDDVSYGNVLAGDVDTVGVEGEHRYGLLQVLLRRPVRQDRDALDEDPLAIAPEIEIKPRRIEHRDVAHHDLCGNQSVSGAPDNFVTVMTIAWRSKAP